jgi:hypothetical protein
VIAREIVNKKKERGKRKEERGIGQKSEVGGQKTEVRTRDDGGRKTEESKNVGG